EFERIGDYSINLMECAEVLYNKQAKFSEKAMLELRAISSAVEEIIQMALVAYRERDILTAMHIEPLEETIDTLQDALKLKHIKRLKNGECTIDTGLVFLEILTNMERISDHCSNVGVYLIGHQKDSETLNRHEYIKKMHQGDTGDYNEWMHEYMEKYVVTLANEVKQLKK
ncbi:MAG: PhoU domain-containing protein, partial [Oscillospiraceae bacterium]